MPIEFLLPLHIGAGALGVASGAAALTARKGARAHRASGLVFLAAMSVMAVTAALLGGDRANIVAGLLVIYFLFTAWWAARRQNGEAGALEVAAGILALCIGAALAMEARLIAIGLKPAANPYIVFVSFAISAAIALAGLGDLSAALRKSLPRPERIARHLWRMCFALLIAVGSFAAQGARILPPSIPRRELLFGSMLIVLVIMIYWLIRVLVFRRFAPTSVTS